MKYRKKPVVIEAERFWPKTSRLPFQDDGAPCCYVDGKWHIPTLEGDHLLTEGDYVIKGIQGEFYPCKPDIFEQTYEPVD